MSHIKEIKSELDGVASDPALKGTSRAWTREILRRLASRGQKHKYCVCSSSPCADYGEFMYDMAWLKYKDDNLLRAVLALECEWNARLDYIREDFQKLLAGIAEDKVLIFQADSESGGQKVMDALVGHIEKFDEGKITGRYLLACYCNATEKFHYRCVG